LVAKDAEDAEEKQKILNCEGCEGRQGKADQKEFIESSSRNLIWRSMSGSGNVIGRY